MESLVKLSMNLGAGVSKYPIICFLSLTAAVSTAYAANLRLNIEGLEGQPNQNVRVQLSTISQDEVVPNGRFRARVTKAIEDGLKPLGYYQPKIEFNKVFCPRHHHPFHRQYVSIIYSRFSDVWSDNSRSKPASFD